MIKHILADGTELKSIRLRKKEAGHLPLQRETDQKDLLVPMVHPQRGIQELPLQEHQRQL